MKRPREILAFFVSPLTTSEEETLGAPPDLVTSWLKFLLFYFFLCVEISIFTSINKQNMSHSKPFPGAPMAGFFFQIKTAQISQGLLGMPGKLGKLGKMYETLSQFLAHNEYPYFVLFTEVMEVYEKKHKPFWDGFLPGLIAIQNSDDESLIYQYMENTYGEYWEKAQDPLTYISALLRFTKDNPTGNEKEEVYILSCILWSIYISVHDNSMFNELYQIFEKNKKTYMPSIQNLN